MSAYHYARRRPAGLLAAALLVTVLLAITFLLNATAAGPASAGHIPTSLLPAADDNAAADTRVIPAGTHHPDPNPAPRRPASQTAPGLTIVKETGWSNGRGRTTEAGGTASFTVRLAAEPDHFVLVQFPSSDTGEGDAKVILYITDNTGNRTVKHPHIVFKPTNYDISNAPIGLVRNWNQATTVTVTGQDDPGDDGDVDYTVTVRADCSIVRNSDPPVKHNCGYDSVASVILPFTNADNDPGAVSPSPDPSPVPQTAGPDFGSATIDDQSWTQNSAITALTLPEATGGSGALTYTLSPDLPDGVSRNAATHRITGTPTVSKARARYTWKATDANGAAAQLQFHITVAPDPSPSFAAAIPEQQWVQNIPITSFYLPEATGGSGSLTYTLSPALPDGVSRNAATRQVTGTPGAAKARTQYTWTATDSQGRTATAQFHITVAATGIIVSKSWSSGRGPTSEDGGAATFTVRLSAQPAPNAIVSISSGDTTEGSVSPSQINFLETAEGSPTGNTSAWNSPYTVTVTGLDDNDVDGAVDYAVTLSAACETLTPNCGYASVSSVTIPMTNADNDRAATPTPEPTPANSPPVITNPGNKSYQQGATITAFNITVTDADPSDTVAVSVTGLPTGLAYDSDAGQVSGTVAADAAAQAYTATITANDGVNSDVTETFTVTVTTPPPAPSNSPPAITNPGNKTYQQGATITAFDITVTDADPSDTVAVSVTGLPTGLAYSASTGQVSGTVAADAAAQAYTATITANDGVNSDVTETFTVTITTPPPAPSNSPPAITNPGNKSYQQGATIPAFDITVTDADPSDTVAISVTGLPTGLAYSASTGQVSGTVAADAAAQAYTATITANDGVNSDVTETFTVTITTPPPAPSNSLPVITNPGDKTYQQGATIPAFDITVTDADASDTVSVSVTGLPSGLAYSASTGQVSGAVAADAAVKDYTATITANDGVNPDVTLDFTITVTAPPNPPVPRRVNSPPAITNPGNKSYQQGATITAFNITVTDADADDTVSVSVTGLPSGLAYRASTGQVSGTVAADAAAQAYTATITANDGVNPDVTETFTVTITTPPPAPSNSPPVITNPGNKTYRQGQSIRPFSIVVTDPDPGDRLTVTLAGLPASLTYDASTGAVQGRVASSAAPGRYTATITARDGHHGPVTDTFRITVITRPTPTPTPRPTQPPANSPPVIANPGDKTYQQGATIAPFNIAVTDADPGDTVTISLTGLPDALSYDSADSSVTGAIAANAVPKNYPVTITAHDGVNPAVTDDFTITVTAAAVVFPTLPPASVTTAPTPPPLPPNNAPPAIVNPGAKTYRQGAAITPFAITVTDADPNDTILVSVTGLPAGLRYRPATTAVAGQVAPDARLGHYIATIIATDGVNDAVSASFVVTITAAAILAPAPTATPAPTPSPTPNLPPSPRAVNTPPAIVNPGDKTYPQGAIIAPFAITVTDADPDDTPIVSVTGLPAGLRYASGSVTGTIPANAVPRDYPVTITATDGVNPAVTAAFTITVTAADILSPAPTATPSPTPTPAPTATPTPTSTPTPSPVAANTPPTIVNPGAKTYRQGATIAPFPIVVTDADPDDTVAVSVTGLPAGLRYHPRAARVAGAVASNAPVRRYPATITAADGVNPAVTATFMVHITPADDSDTRPAISILPASTPQPTPAPTPAPTPLPTATPTPTLTPTPTVVPTPTPTPLPTLTPTPTPTPSPYDDDDDDDDDDGNNPGGSGGDDDDGDDDTTASAASPTGSGPAPTSPPAGAGETLTVAQISDLLELLRNGRRNPAAPQQVSAPITPAELIAAMARLRRAGSAEPTPTPTPAWHGGGPSVTPTPTPTPTLGPAAALPPDAATPTPPPSAPTDTTGAPPTPYWWLWLLLLLVLILLFVGYLFSRRRRRAV